MIHIGYNIRQANDPLQRIEAAELARKISKPDERFVAFIEHLRMVMTIDPRKYRELKTRLPYVVAASFNPPYRRIENFSHCNTLILDFDHLKAKQIEIPQLRKRINQDPRVLLSFTSPSADGFKVFFTFEPRLTDHGKYSIFYKLFAQKIAREYKLEQVIDKSTSDVGRACFVSYDPEAHYNPAPEPVKVSSIVDFDNQVSLHELLSASKAQTEETLEQQADQPDLLKVTSQDLPDELLRTIKEQLNPALAHKREKKIYVPPQLEELMPTIAQLLANKGLKLDEVKNIHYGKQLRAIAGHAWGEINLFYGKRGYTVVRSNKSGSDERITEALAILVESMLYNESAPET